LEAGPLKLRRSSGLQRWAAGLAARAAGVLTRSRAKRELEALERPPAASQHLRAFIQINLHPSPR